MSIKQNRNNLKLDNSKIQTFGITMKFTAQCGETDHEDRDYHENGTISYKSIMASDLADQNSLLVLNR